MEIIWLAFFDGDTEFFQVILKNCPKIFFCFFFYRKSNFVRKFFSKIFFCMQNLVFCVHNLVLDTMIFVFFSPNFFFQKRWKILFLLNGEFMYALINIW